MSAFFTAALAASISFCRQSSRHIYDNRSVTSCFPPICLTRGIKSRLLNSASRKATSKPCFRSSASSFCQSSSCLSGFIRCRDSITIPARRGWPFSHPPQTSVSGGRKTISVGIRDEPGYSSQKLPVQPNPLKKPQHLLSLCHLCELDRAAWPRLLPPLFPLSNSFLGDAELRR